MILHVTGTLNALWIEIPFELREDFSVGLAHDVGEEVQSPSVGGPENHFSGSRNCGCVDQCIEDHHCRFSAFEAESLLADIPGVEEPLEDLGGVETIQDVSLLIDLERHVHPFDVLLDPLLLARVLNVHVLNGKGPAIGIPQDIENFVKRGGRLTGEAI